MDILTFIVFVVLFIILMVFIFSIGMLRPFMPKKEMILVIVCAFIIGSLGGAFFLSPIYEELPQVASIVEKIIPTNKEVVYLDVSSASDLEELQDNITHTKGVQSIEVTGITFNLWKMNDQEKAYINSCIGNINPNYSNWTINSSGKVDISLAKGSDISQSLKSFSDWFNIVYGTSISYAVVHMKVVVSSSELDHLEENLFTKEIIPTKVEGPVQNTKDRVNASMLSYNEFVIVSGGFGVFVSLLGIYFDSIVVNYRKFKKFINTKILKKR